MSENTKSENRFITFFNFFLKKSLDTPVTGKLIGMLVVSLVGFTIVYGHESIALRSIEQRVAVVRGVNMPQYKVCQLILRGINGFKISLLHTLDLHADDEDSDFATHNQDNYTRLNQYRHMLDTLIRGGVIQDITNISDITLDSFKATPADPNSKQFADIKRIICAVDMLDDSHTIFTQTLRQSHTEEELDVALENLTDNLDQLYTQLTEFSLSVNDEFTEQMDATEFIIQRAMGHFLFICTLTVITLSIGTIIYIFIIVMPLKTILSSIKEIAKGEGDLSVRIDVRSNDEVGQLATQLNYLVDNIQTLNSFKAVIEEEETPTDVHLRLANIIKSRYHLDCFFSYEINKTQKTMSVAFASDHQLICNPDIMENCSLCRAKRTGHYISSLQHPSICKMFPHAETMQHFCIPMIAGGRVIGIIQFLHPRETTDNDRLIFENQVQHAWRYIKEATPVIEAKRFAAALRETTLKDPMTDLYNRRFLETYMDTLVANAKRRASNIGILMCDMDFFKEVNDTHGHEAGDVVIIKTAEILKECVRTSDLVIRYGGEEFLIILVDVATKDDITRVAENIRATMEATTMQLPGGGTLQKTISVGYSMFPFDSNGFWECIKFADVALYEAKGNGRNQTQVFKKSLWDQKPY
ncbi:MAG: diguanylate cyclase [Spirochaetales bacterium]|jgi:two-component system cell cycle response regulator|nr:diguanylate cyclase [Spirochaetales bacterium]